MDWLVIYFYVPNLVYSPSGDVAILNLVLKYFYMYTLLKSIYDFNKV
ncbi:hypothetical protein Ctaglu_08740 [Clostridium tagluense]|uniref:Uncharacterized protein n=1 Tax=Clostridium tagluense TaxID=360422 RepID=A0A401UI62_9CLOT|nr:hypothetical protein Ctaglu_08740 [Clostridium tagluense]